MKHYEKLIELGCFSRKQLVSMLGNEATAGSMIRDYLGKGYIERVRRDLYAVISLETKQPVFSRYAIGNALFSDAVISHHSAFEMYGCANQVYYVVYVATENRFADFTYAGITYHRLLPKKGASSTLINRVRVTCIEQTVIDSIADYEKIAGLEETLRCISLVPTLNEQKLLDILTARNNGFLWQKCGYLLSVLNDRLHLSEDFYENCQKHKTESKRPLLMDPPYSQQWNSEWGLYTPINFNDFLNKGIGDYDAF